MSTSSRRARPGERAVCCERHDDELVFSCASCGEQSVPDLGSRSTFQEARNLTTQYFESVDWHQIEMKCRGERCLQMNDFLKEGGHDRHNEA